MKNKIISICILCVFLAVLSGCIPSENDITHSSRSQTTDTVKEKAQLYLEGESSCMAVYKKSELESEILLYSFCDDNKLCWVQSEIVGSLSFSSIGTENKDYGIVKVMKGTDCSDYFVVGSVYSDKTTYPDISDNYGSTYYISCITENHPEYKTQIFDFFSIISDFNNLTIDINGTAMTVKHSNS